MLRKIYRCSRKIITATEDLQVFRKTYYLLQSIFVNAPEDLLTAPEHLLTASEHFRTCSVALTNYSGRLTAMDHLNHHWGLGVTQIKAWIYDCIHCFMCNGITCWLSIVDAFNFNVWFRTCMSNNTPLFCNEIILTHFLTPDLGWQISVCKRNPSWRKYIWVRLRAIIWIDGLFSIGP